MQYVAVSHRRMWGSALLVSTDSARRETLGGAKRSRAGESASRDQIRPVQPEGDIPGRRSHGRARPSRQGRRRPRDVCRHSTRLRSCTTAFAPGNCSRTCTGERRSVQRKPRRRAATLSRSPPRRVARRRPAALARSAAPEAPPASRGHCRETPVPSSPRAIRQKPPPRVPHWDRPKSGCRNGSARLAYSGKPWLREHPRTRHGLVNAFIRIPSRRKADCVKAPAAGGEMGLENRLDA